MADAFFLEGRTWRDAGDHSGPAKIKLVDNGDGTYSLAVAGSSSSGSVAVSNFPALQDVQGVVAISNLPATQAIAGAVSITNLPTTQPVSGTVSINGTVSVSGNFWQATQPVSGPLTDAQLRANPVGMVAPSITKGTQGATGLSVQDLKDAGRTLRTFAATFTGTTTEGMVTLTPVSGGTAGTNGTSFAVTAGKTLRLTGMSVTTKNAGAAGQGTVANLRISATGAVTTTTPLAATVAAGTGLAVANIAATGFVAFPDGLELSGTMQVGISQLGTATAGNTVTLYGFEY